MTSESEVMPDGETAAGQHITQPPRLEGANWAIPTWWQLIGPGEGEIRWFRYVPHHRVLAHLMAGWKYDCDLGDHHGTYCVLMTWAGEGEMREP